MKKRNIIIGAILTFSIGALTGSVCESIANQRSVNKSEVEMAGKIIRFQENIANSTQKGDIDWDTGVEICDSLQVLVEDLTGKPFSYYE